MGLEYISQPQVFTAPITALQGIQGINEAYPLLTTYQFWTSTAVIPTSTFPIPGLWTMLDSPGSFLIAISGVLQPATKYTIDRNNRLVNFNFVISADTEVSFTQLATHAPSSQSFNYIESISSQFVNLSANNAVIQSLTTINVITDSLTATNLLVTNLTALSSVLNIVDVTQYELSGFNILGNASIAGNVNVTSNLGVNGDLSATNINVTNLLSSNRIDVNVLSAREIKLIHTPPNDGAEPILEIGETTTEGFSGFRIRYDELENRLFIEKVDPVLTTDSVVIDRTTGRVGISAVPNEALTVVGNISATGAIRAINTWPNSSYFILTANTPTVAPGTGLVFFPLASGGEITLQPNLIYRVDMTPSLSTTYVSTAYNLTYSLSGNNIFTVLEGYGSNTSNSTDPYAANFKNLGTGNAFHFVTTSNANIFNSGTFNFILSSSSTTTILMTGVTTTVSAYSRKASSRWTADVIGRV